MGSSVETMAELQQENAQLHKRITELEHQLAHQREVEQALRDQVSMFSQTLDAIGDMVLIKGPKSRILYGNKAFRELYGMTQEQLRDLIDAPFNEPDYTQQYIKDDAYVFTTGQTLDIPQEYVVRHDGATRTVHTVKSPLFNSSGQIAWTVGIFEDITERLEADTRLHKSEQLYRAFARNLPNGAVFLFDPDLRYMLVDGSDLPSIGLNKEAVEGKTLWEVASAELCAEMEGPYRAALEGKATVIEAEFADRIYEVHISPVGNDEGTIFAGMALTQDITRRKQAEQALRDSEQRLTQFLNGLPIGVFVIDKNGHPCYANQTAQQLLGRGIIPTAGVDHLAEIYDAYITGTNEPYPSERMPLVRALHGEQVTVDDMEIWHPDRVIPLEVSGTPIRDAQGTVVYAMTAFSDSTERRHAAEAIRQRVRQEEIIYAQRAALAELSTPLIPLNDRMLVMPLIGAIDSYRAQQVMEALLEGIARKRAEVAILDITGVQVIDSQVAHALIQTAQAVQLLGAQVVLTGIRPDVAQTLVHLGIDFRGIVTRSNLQAGIAYALH